MICITTNEKSKHKNKLFKRKKLERGMRWCNKTYIDEFIYVDFLGSVKSKPEIKKTMNGLP